MNDVKFELLEGLKDELTIEAAMLLYENGIVTICEDGRPVHFDFECCPECKVCGF
jgi:NAD-dependent dihydropyrimidine dehydrogenase PreA subunit